MRRVFLVLFALLIAPLAAARGEPVVAVTERAFIDVHTGPGRGYPVFNVIERDVPFEILARRTDWFRVRDERGAVGWVALASLVDARTDSGAELPIDGADAGDWQSRRFLASATLGDFGGADAIGVQLAYRFTRNLSVEVAASEFSGRFSDGWTAGARLVHEPLPDLRVSPFFALGTGVVSVRPRATLAERTERTDQSASVAIGVRAYLTRRFLLRAEFERHLIFTDRNENEEVNEWKTGFAFFF